MSKPYDRCALAGCGYWRDAHPVRIREHGHGFHDFVEPDAAPQPPADALSVADEFDRTDYGAGYKAGFADGRDYESSPEAAQPVTGDGDEAVVREILEPWLDKLPGVSSFDMAALVRAGIARGRALGARDENVACEKQLRDRCRASLALDRNAIEAPTQQSIALSAAADAIARRAGRGTL